MTDNQSRKLRARRPPPYLIGDNSDPELFGYARTNFTKDFVSPAQELNSLAKALAKFVNSANKHLAEKSNDAQSQENPPAKTKGQQPDQLSKKTQTNTQASKRKQNQKYDSRDNNVKAPKEIGGLKNQTPEPQPSKQKIKGEEGAKKEGQQNKGGKKINRPGYMNDMNYMSKYQELKQQQGLDIGNLSRMQIDAAARAMQQQQEILNYNPNLREKLQAQNNFDGKGQHGGEKFFRRSTYHIAIAYHIHLNNIKDSGKDLQTPMILDPTYQAKKLKGEYDQHSMGAKR